MKKYGVKGVAVLHPATRDYDDNQSGFSQEARKVVRSELNGQEGGMRCFDCRSNSSLVPDG